MSLPSSILSSNSITQSTFLSHLTLGVATSSLTTTTRLTATAAESQQVDESSPKSSSNIMSRFSFLRNLPPRAKATVYMAAAMSLHYGGYEFLRNSSIALFTSERYGFQSPAAFPFASALVSPFSLGILYVYGQQLEKGGPRYALRNTTVISILFIALASFLLSQNLPKVAMQTVMGFSFLFQNSYSYMLSAQQWSFTDSVLTPDEGARWFGTITGVSSLICTLTGSLVPVLLPRTGLVGLFSLTAVTLTMSLLCADRAYALSQKHGFDPAAAQHKIAKSKEGASSNDDNENSQSRVAQAAELFRRVPTLRALFTEGIAFQSFSTLVNIAMIRALRIEIPDDMARSAFAGRFFSAVSGASAICQFVLLPTFLKYLEPKRIWRLMPLMPFGVCLFQCLPHGNSSLILMASALFTTKVMDYSLRSVVYNMVYQPLDFESRFLGKEIIGVFGSRFGKSGMSLLISGVSSLGLLSSLRELSYLSLTANTGWIFSTYWLSSMLPKQAEAQAVVEERRRTLQKEIESKED